MSAESWVEIPVAFLLVAGGAFALIGSIGLARLSDFFLRIHGPTKVTTLGVGSVLLASMLHFSSQGAGIAAQELLILLFLFITAPVSAHALVKAALRLGLGKPRPSNPPEE